MMHGSHDLMELRELVSDGSAVIVAPVINDDHFMLARAAPERSEDLLHRALEGRRFVVAGDHHRDGSGHRLVS